MNASPSPQIMLTINAAPDADQKEVEELTQSLFAELDPIANVARVSSGNAPAGSKAIGVDIIGQLALSFLHSGGVLVTAIGAAQAWLLRQNARSIVIEFEGTKIEVKGPSSEEQRRLIATWIKHVEEAAQTKSDKK
ncbi:hypothetical protein SAMN05446927_4269 [Caballeronia arationis]|uniref:Uncharacterized protein n=1 Tax=Caballeronia arationis TaxID=1777142 RepID=A0A7Z7I828_9BURK|nr:hypothetical protein [Caballeronia arationis]SOE81015.1 hypothetical protein SAMN05446927_4269 [Caballeronia arationis]